MLKTSTFVLLLLFCVIAVGCSPFRALVYTDVKEPGLGRPDGLTGVYSYSSATTVSYEIDNSKGAGSKTGSGSVINILGLFAFGDASIAGATEDGNIKTIHTIDGTYRNFLFIFSSWTTQVTGE